jgi:GDP-L-fucose synthase
MSGFQFGDDVTIGVAGATGLVGRHIVEALAQADRGSVVATFRARAPFEVPKTTWVKCDLRDREAARAALTAVDTAVLCAGQLSTSAVLRGDPVSSVLDTLRITTNLLEAAARGRTKRVILIGSCTGYPDLAAPAVEPDMAQGDPPSQWFGVGWMHRYLEKQLRWYVEHLGLIGSAISLRPTLVYGAYDDFSPASAHFVPSMIRKVVERDCPIEIWGDGRQTRNLLHASDLAQAVLAVLEPSPASVEAFNVASPDDVSVNDVVDHLIELDGFSEAVVTHDLARAAGPAALRVSGQAFGAATGWRAKKGVREGLAETLAWFRRSRP